MNTTGEKILSKLEVRKRLGVSRARYDLLVESGILPRPFALIPGSRPVHTESQVRIAALNLERRALAEYKSTQAAGGRATKPLKPLAPGEFSRGRGQL